MKPRWLLCVMILSGIYHTVFAQNPMNQTDSSGRKNGKWIVYLNQHGNEQKDSVNAWYYRYTFYDHGTNLYPMGGFILKGGRIEFSDSLMKRPKKPILLNGELKCLNKKGEIRFIHKFDHGLYVFCKEFYTNGQLMAHFDYTRLYKNTPNTWRYTDYRKDGIVKYHGYFRKVNKTWSIFPCMASE